MTYIGIDIETTGLNPAQGHRLIQIGLYMGGQMAFKIVKDVLPIGSMTIDQSALNVNGFNLARIGAGTPNDEIDYDLYNQLHGIYKFNEGDIIAVGWNVGSFDMDFIKKEMPKFATLFSHRCCDLSGAAMLISDALGWGNWRDLKAHVQSEVEKEMAGGAPSKWHDAGWDAEAAYKAMPILKRFIKDGV